MSNDSSQKPRRMYNGVEALFETRAPSVWRDFNVDLVRWVVKYAGRPHPDHPRPLAAAFPWANTQQGDDFWAGVNMELSMGKALPESAHAILSGALDEYNDADYVQLPSPRVHEDGLALFIEAPGDGARGWPSFDEDSVRIALDAKVGAMARHDALIRAFAWTRTQQGYTYWNQACERLRMTRTLWSEASRILRSALGEHVAAKALLQAELDARVRAEKDAEAAEAATKALAGEMQLQDAKRYVERLEDALIEYVTSLELACATRGTENPLRGVADAAIARVVALNPSPFTGAALAPRLAENLARVKSRPGAGTPVMGKQVHALAVGHRVRLRKLPGESATSPWRGTVTSVGYSGDTVTVRWDDIPRAPADQRPEDGVLRMSVSLRRVGWAITRPLGTAGMSPDARDILEPTDAYVKDTHESAARFLEQLAREIPEVGPQLELCEVDLHDDGTPCRTRFYD